MHLRFAVIIISAGIIGIIFLASSSSSVVNIVATIRRLRGGIGAHEHEDAHANTNTNTLALVVSEYILMHSCFCYHLSIAFASFSPL